LSSKDDNNRKKKKQNHKTTEVVGKVIGTCKPGIVCTLLDTGASATIILKDAIISGYRYKVEKYLSSSFLMWQTQNTVCTRGHTGSR
jgi:hypothetical protein